MAEKETRLASLTTKVKELQEALATTSATAAAAAADSTHFFSAAAALATAETQAAEMAADATQALANKEKEAQELRRRVRAVEEEKQACYVLGVLREVQKIAIADACVFSL